MYGRAVGWRNRATPAPVRGVPGATHTEEGQCMGEIVPMRAPALKPMWGNFGGYDKPEDGSNLGISPGIRAVRARKVRPSARRGAPAPRRGAGTGVTRALGAVACGTRHMRPPRAGIRAVRARKVRPSARRL